MAIPTRFDALVAQSTTAYIVKYHPGQVWLEPEYETIEVAEVSHHFDTQTQTHAIYRRDTNFAGSLSEAVRVIEFSKACI